MIAKSRLDALSDGVFSVAMTLLVIDLKLPEHFQPKDAADLVSALADLWPQFLVYAISFLVIGLRWWSMSRLFAHTEVAPPQLVKWTLFHLFLITCVPFSTIVLGRYGAFAPAVWLYAVNMSLGALVAMRIVALIDAERGGTLIVGPYYANYGLVIGTSAIAAAISFVDPRHALWIYVLNAGLPLFARIRAAA